MRSEYLRKIGRYTDTELKDRFVGKHNFIYHDRMIPAYYPGEMEIPFDVEVPSLGLNSTLSNDIYNKILINELLDLPPRDRAEDDNSPTRLFSYRRSRSDVLDSPYSISPLGINSQRILRSNIKTQRVIPENPYKILQATNILDDFYLNLLDWSSQNIVALALESSVCLWNATTSEVSILCSFPGYISSLAWMNRGTHIAVGLRDGTVSLWDVEKSKRVRTFFGHTKRVGSLSWNGCILASGSKDNTILFRDVRTRNNSLDLGPNKNHEQEVCGLTWETELGYLASGGNDNKVNIWDMRKCDGYLYQHRDHVAAVKALAWSSFQRGILATGGGSADKCISIRDCVNNTKLDHIDTGSQVCNLKWSSTTKELVSTHGFSGNQIVVWSYPYMTKTAILTGHKSRVLYLSLSPDGQTIATAAGDNQLRLWKIFPPKKKEQLSFASTETIR